VGYPVLGSSSYPWAPNKSFKPNLLRYSKSVAKKACHAFASSTQVGLTQVLGVLTSTFHVATLLSCVAALQFNMYKTVNYEGNPDHGIT